jgi:hypothetical protein
MIKGCRLDKAATSGVSALWYRYRQDSPSQKKTLKKRWQSTYCVRGDFKGNQTHNVG